MPKVKRIKVQIKGEPYTITQNVHGWGITNTTAKTNNFHRSYQVYAGANGRPERCSCPHNTRRGVPCKHITAISEWLATADREEQVATLEHPSKAKCFRFAKLASGAVSYQRWEDGKLVIDIVITHEDAANRWRHLYNLGYRQFGAMSKGRN